MLILTNFVKTNIAQTSEADTWEGPEGVRFIEVSLYYKTRTFR